MSRDNMRQIGVRRLDLSGGGGRRVEYLLAGALAVVILGSLGLTIWSFIGKKGGYGAPDLRFQCQNPECPGKGSDGQLYEFTIAQDKMYPEFSRENPPTPEQMQQMYGAYGPGMMGPGGAMTYKCPECGQMAIQMTQCRYKDCKAWFVSPLAKDPNLLRQMMINRQTPNVICPACNRSQTISRPPPSE